MKVLFLVAGYSDIYGPYAHLYRRGFLNPPLSLCYLAAAVADLGHQARIIDGDGENLSLAGIIRHARSYEPDLIGITATSVDFESARALSAGLKQAMPATPIIIGGTHVNIFGPKVMEDTPEIDFACVGDGEDLIRELTEALANKGGEADLGKIQGLIFRSGGAIYKNAYRPLERDINRYPFPARHMLRNDLYRRAVPKRGYQLATAFMSSRGCPFSCIYCAVKQIHGGDKVRLRSAENVLDELEHIERELRIPHISFNDDCLTLNKSRIYEICEGIRARGLSLTWEGLSRADLVDKDLLMAMKKSGFVRISYGIETGNPELLKIIDKRESLDQITEAFRITEEVGIVARGSIIIGLPYETRETVEETFRFLRTLPGISQAAINILQPYPGTRVRDMILNCEGGSKLIGEEFDNYTGLRRLGSAQIQINDLTPERLVSLQRSGFLRFYFRPSIIWRNLKGLGLKVCFQDGVGFLRSLVA